MKNLLFLFLSVFILASCGPKIYSDPKADSIAKKHKIMAILPPKVSIPANKKVTAEAMQEQQKTESETFQREMYSWMLKRNTQGKMDIEIQDVETTTALLTKAGYFEGKNTRTPKELAEILNVDGVLTSNYALTKPMSEGAAVAMAVLVGVWGATNSTTVDLSLHDRATGKAFWNYNHKASGSFTNASSLVDNLMRNASKRMPYVQKKK